METRLMESPEELSQILKLDDTIEDEIIGDKGEWVQWLVQSLEEENSKIYVFGIFDENDILKAYTVLIDSRTPPIANEFFIIYAYSKLNHKANLNSFNTIKNYLKDNGVNRIAAVTKNPMALERFGFKEKESVNMIMEI